jgi:hypothetical protein
MELLLHASGYNDIVDTKEKVSVNNLIPSKFGVYNVAKDLFILSFYFEPYSRCTKIF